MKLFRITSAMVAAVFLASCGGGDGAPPTQQAPTPAPAPTPTPTPTPPPAAISEVARIFADPGLTDRFFITGGGWLVDTINPDSRMLDVDRSVFDLTYDAPTDQYRVASKLYGNGALSRVSNHFAWYGGLGSFFAARPAMLPDASYFELMVMEPRLAGDPYDHVAILSPSFSDGGNSNSRRTSWLVVGAGQETPLAALPASGRIRYIGDLAATMFDNFGDMVIGSVELEIDFDTGTVSGRVVNYFECYMGCSYPPVEHAINDGQFDRATGVISARIGSEDGSIEGRFAGPNAEEGLLRASFDFLEPQSARTVRSSGVILLRRSDRPS